MRMKKLVALTLSLIMAFSFTANALAIDAPTCPLNVITGTLVDDEVVNDTSRAVNVPTSFAPNSWYNTVHSWTAQNYTWSSYKFTWEKGTFADFEATKPFKVEFHYESGDVMATVAAVKSGSKYILQTEFDKPFTGDDGYYFRIINTSSSAITSGATYEVFGY